MRFAHSPDEGSPARQPHLWHPVRTEGKDARNNETRNIKKGRGRWQGVTRALQGHIPAVYPTGARGQSPRSSRGAPQAASGFPATRPAPLGRTAPPANGLRSVQPEGRDWAGTHQ